MYFEGEGGGLSVVSALICEKELDSEELLLPGLTGSNGFEDGREGRGGAGGLLSSSKSSKQIKVPLFGRPETECR